MAQMCRYFAPGSEYPIEARPGSLVVYLNEVAGGGETDFPEIGFAVCPQPAARYFFKCAGGEAWICAIFGMGGGAYCQIEIRVTEEKG
jgi:hypothetical protein